MAVVVGSVADILRRFFSIPAQILADALLPLPRNPMSGVVSPPLLATTGIVPCSIFSTGPDIIEHYCDCIVAAKREVILLTNYWQGGKNVNRIADALRELNKRVQERQAKSETNTTSTTTAAATGTPANKAPPLETIVVKIMWDRGPQTLADLFRCRKPVPPSMWKSNGLPTQEEVPNLNIEILNYHRPLMGTFHAKLLLVDRQVALINSNNIQDRPNVEACTRLEGDIVNSIYDHALISWGDALNPPLPCLGTPAPRDPSPSAFVQGEEGNLPSMSQDKLLQLARDARRRLQEEDEETEEEKHKQGMASPSRRMSLADVVDGVIKYGHQTSSSGGGGVGGLPRRKSMQEAATPGGDTADDEHAAAATSEQQHRSARHAGATWASKVLGSERARHENKSSADDSNNTGTLPSEQPHSSTQTQQSQITSDKADSSPLQPPTKPFAAARDGASTPPRAHFATLPSTAHTPPSSPGGKRHFADVVEAMMKKEGIKPGLWAEGALDTLGLGPSSSRNVADEVRRSREQRGRTGASSTAMSPSSSSGVRSVSVPRAVKEEKRNGRRDSSGSASSTDLPGNDEHVTDEDGVQTHVKQGGVVGNGMSADPSVDPTTVVPTVGQPMSEKLSVPDANDGAPGSVGYRRKHRRTLSSLSKASASQRLAQITKSLDFANLSQVKGEIKADELSRFSSTAAGTNGGAGSGGDAATQAQNGTAPADSSAPVGTTEPQSPSTTVHGLPGDSATSEKEALAAEQHKTDAVIAKATEKSLQESFATGASDVLDFRPYVFHARHDPVPMALMNRRPHGTPGHSDIRNPQDAAWLAGFRYAKNHIFIQSPTLNASPIKAAVLAAVRRHVRVELWLDLGFNDKSESMPFQGGTNEQVVTRLYRQLRREGKGDEKYLEVFWYTGKDMTRPLNAVRKQRNCHVKYAAFDGQVAILGSGNQDTQSWFHSQEINVCVDSKQIVDEWDKALRRNQSTGIYGRVDDDGIWRGNSGSEIADTGKE